MSLVQNSVTEVDFDPAETIKQQIEELKEKLQQSVPGYESLLHTIHRALAASPDTVHLLTDEQIGVICAGLKKRTNVVVFEETVKKVSKKGKIELTDLM